MLGDVLASPNITRVIEEGVGGLEGPCKEGRRNGPGEYRPKVLRDIPLAGPGCMRGGEKCSKEGVKSTEECLISTDGLGFDQVNPSQETSGSLSSSTRGPSCEEEVGGVDTTERSKKGKVHKKKQKAHHYGHKFLMLQEYLQKKGASKSKRKSKKRDAKLQCARSEEVEESDPISCSGGMVVADRRECDQGGIFLEVVLDSGGGLEVNGRAVEDGVEAGVEGTNLEGVGLGMLSAHSEGGRVMIDCNQAHHVIDILEEVGMNFNGSREENVRRVAEAEERDRAKLLAWEQNIGHQ
jgi:hypothetical protein